MVYHSFQIVYKDLLTEENILLKQYPAAKSRLKEILLKYSQVFSSPENVIGQTNLMNFQVRLNNSGQVHRDRCRPLNPQLKESLREQIDLWLKEGIIEECNSPWASAMVPVSKAGGGVRWCVDYRPLNKMTIHDSYPLPNIGDNLDKLQGATVFSTLDASAAYHVIPVEKKSKPYLAFICPFGTFTYKRMPFGARNAAATYSRFIDMVLDKLRSPHVLGYVDDVIIATPSVEKHLTELENVLAAHEEAGIKLKPEKTNLFRVETTYLGYKVNKDGIHMREDYVSRILAWPSPKTGKELRSLLGFMSYYRSFIPRFSELTQDMNGQRSSKGEIQWTAQMEQCLQDLKSEFRQGRIRSYPRFDISDPFILTTDFSSGAIAAILSQMQEGEEKFLAAAGRKTTIYERNYASVKGELAAVIFALRRFEHVLRFRHFKLLTDSAALRYIRSLKQSKGIWFRWSMEVESYQFTVEHRAGKLIGHVDGLSRSSHLPEPEAQEEAEQREFEYIASLASLE